MDELLKRIVVNPRVMGGRPIIKGTRVAVEHIMRELANGMSVDELLDAHPHLAEADILAARAYSR